jgi:outer membrane protein assembly factor BamB
MFNLIGAGFCAALVLAALFIPFVNADWYMYRSDPAHTGAETGSPVLTPTLLWNDSLTAIVEPNSIMGMSTPAIVGGVVYVGELTYVPDGNFFDKVDNIFAFNASTGSMIWDYNAPYGGGVNVPAVDNGVVFFTSYSAGGYVAALNTSNQALLWAYPTELGPYADLDVANGVVYFTAAYQNPYLYVVCALSGTDGASIWNYTTQQLDGPPSVANGVVYFSSFDGKVYALNATDGAFLWAYALSEYGGGTIAVSDGVAYVCSGDLYAVNASNGEELWSFSVGGDLTSPAVCNGAVYVASDSEVYAVNVSTGKLIWDFNIGGGAGYDPVVVSGVVYACASGGSLYAINASSGKELWTYPISGDLAVANGVIYISWGPTFSNGMLKSNDSHIVAIGDPLTPPPSPSPSLTPTTVATPTPSPTLTPSPSVPEFPAWLVPSVFLVTAFAAMAFARKKKQTGRCP